MLVINIHW